MILKAGILIKTDEDFYNGSRRKNERHKNGEKTSRGAQCERAARDPVRSNEYLLRQGQFLLFDLLKRLKRILVCYFKPF